MAKLSRRELVRVAGGMTAAQAVRLDAQTPVQPAYIGPLTGVTTDLRDRRFDPVAYTRDLYAAAPRQLRFRARNRREAEAWQKTLRSKLTELVGGFPTARTPLRAITLETRAFPGYVREKIVFDSQPGVSVLAYLLLPEKVRRPAAVMICVPGHGRGVDDIVGIDEQGGERTDKAGYQHDFAIQVAEAGMAALAIEPMGFGCRRDAINAGLGLSRKACDPAAGGALLVGQTMIGWRVWDVMRTHRLHRDALGVGCRAAWAAWASRGAAL